MLQVNDKAQPCLLYLTVTAMAVDCFFH